MSEEPKSCKNPETPSTGAVIRRDMGRRSTNFSQAAAASKAEPDAPESARKKLPPRPGRVAPESEVPEREVLNAQQRPKS